MEPILDVLGWALQGCLPTGSGTGRGTGRGPNPWLPKPPGSRALGIPHQPAPAPCGSPSRALTGRPPPALPSTKASPPTLPVAAPLSHSTLFSEPFVTAPGTKARERKRQGVGKGRKTKKKKIREREQEGKKEGGQGVKRARSVAERGGGEIMK